MFWTDLVVVPRDQRDERFTNAFATALAVFNDQLVAESIATLAVKPSLDDHLQDVRIELARVLANDYDRVDEHLKRARKTIASKPVLAELFESINEDVRLVGEVAVVEILAAPEKKRDDDLYESDSREAARQAILAQKALGFPDGWQRQAFHDWNVSKRKPRKAREAERATRDAAMRVPNLDGGAA